MALSKFNPSLRNAVSVYRFEMLSNSLGILRAVNLYIVIYRYISLAIWKLTLKMGLLVKKTSTGMYLTPSYYLLF